MNKRMFVLIVFLMSISLIGIILVQIYWIQNAIESRDKQFKNDVQHALARTSEIIQIGRASCRERVYAPV